MSKLHIQVCEVSNVTPVEGSERLDTINALGWQLVVGRGQYKDGDKIVYIPPDAVLPKEFSDSIGVTNYLSSDGRTKVVKLLGQPSYGIAIKPEMDWPVGTDVTDYFVEKYGVSKYDPPEPQDSSIIVGHPFFVSYTDIQHIKDFPDLIPADTPVAVYEKIHGTNCRYGMVEGERMAGSLKERRLFPGEDGRKCFDHLYWRPHAIPGVRAFVDEMGAKHNQVIVYGETFGAVQGLKYGLGNKKDFAMFDIMIDGKYLNDADLNSISKTYDIAMVPHVGVFPYQLDTIIKLSEGQSLVPGANHYREGVVVRPLEEMFNPKVGRLILKCVSNTYSTNKGKEKIK